MHKGWTVVFSSDQPYPQQRDSECSESLQPTQKDSAEVLTSGNWQSKPSRLSARILPRRAACESEFAEHAMAWLLEALD